MKISLLLICLVLGGLIYYLTMYYPRNTENVAGVAPSISVAESVQSTSTRAKSLRAYADVVRRPLFSPDRRPPAVENAQVDDSIDIGELENLILFGVVISGSTKYAIVGNRKEESTEQIKEGHRYKGWRVSAISSDSIQFVGKDAQYELFISPNDTTKKSGLRNTPHESKKPVHQSIFRSVRKKGESPIKLPAAQPAPKPHVDIEEEIPPELLEQLGEEGGYEFDLDEEFDDEYIE